MAVYRLADLILQVDGANEYTSRVLSRYQADAAKAGKPDIFVSVTSDMVDREQRIEGDRFSRDYLELEAKKKELETKIALCLREGNCEEAKVLCERLGSIVEQM